MRSRTTLMQEAIREERKRNTPKPVKRRNRERVESALRAILAHDPDSEKADGTALPSLEYIVDLFTNLIHLCHREGIDHLKAFAMARDHYETEK